MIQPLAHTSRNDSSSIITDTHRRAALRTLLYYDLFHFPLRIDELRRYSDIHWPDPSTLDAAIDSLVDQGLIERENEWLHLGRHILIEERMEAQAQGERVMPRAIRRSRLIAHFPFVRAVALSGTLSKGVFARGDDVDFFVITSPGRLWICRVLLMSFKKIFLFNSRRTFCINYLVTEDHLEVPDHNFFTATEIAWLAPIVNAELFEAFIKATDWIREFLPTWVPTTNRPTSGWRHSLPARAIETLFSGNRGDSLDERCRRLVERHNRHRYNHLEPTEFELAMRTAKNASKHHPRSFQPRILQRFDDRIREFENRHNVSLNPR
jgi:hypothetical protein